MYLQQEIYLQYKDKAELELGPEAESAVGWSRLGNL